MFVKLAKRATVRAQRKQSLRLLKLAWWLREVATWLRGGDISLTSYRIRKETAARRRRPFAETIAEGPGL